MDITLTTPAVLFPAISLLLLAYTNRFIGLAQIIRNFDSDQQSDEDVKLQIANLRQRIVLIKRMQEAGVISFFLCVVSMLAVYAQYSKIGSGVFAASLLFLLYSLWLSVREIRISVQALDVYLKHFNVKPKSKKWIKSDTTN